MAHFIAMYCRGSDQIDAQTVEAALRAAEAASSEPVKEVRGEDGALISVTAKVSDVNVTVRSMPAELRPDHLREFADFLRKRSDVSDKEQPAVDRVANADGVLALVFDPSFDEEGACARFVRDLAARKDALVYQTDGALVDPSGDELLQPIRPAFDFVDVEEEKKAAKKAARGAAANGGPATPATVATSATAATPAAPAAAAQEEGPPSAERVARRSLVVLALAWRAHAERSARGPDAAVSDAAACKWVEKQGLLPEMELEEVRLLHAPLGSWTERERLDFGWGLEGAAVLAWALGKLELPPLDRQVDPTRLGTALGLFAPAPAALAAPALRTPQEIEAMRDRLFAILWRVNKFLKEKGAFDFENYARVSGFGSLQSEGIVIVEGDLSIRGEPISKVKEELAHVTHSIAMERYRAIEWVAGASAAWSQVEISTE